MIESAVELRLKREVEKLGCECWKFTSPGRRGVPDRVILIYPKITEWVETKRPKGTPEPLQIWQHKQIIKKGWERVWIIDTYELVDEFIEYLKLKYGL